MDDVVSPEGTPHVPPVGGVHPRDVSNPVREELMDAFIRDACPVVNMFMQASSV